MTIAGRRAAYVAGWMAARIYYGSSGRYGAEDGSSEHGAECARVQGPYVCTCDPGGERSTAREEARYRFPDRGQPVRLAPGAGWQRVTS